MTNKDILTKVTRFEKFYNAESRHQKNHLRRHPGLLATFPQDDDLSDSFLATRINGYLAGFGKMSAFNKEWQELGLNKKMAEYVRTVIIKRG